MLIGLIADTHIARPEEKLPPQVADAFKGVELILHAGDVWIPSVLDELEAIAPVAAAWGDDDMETDLGPDPRMISERTLYLEGITLWLVHEKPAYGHIVPRENRVYSRPVNHDHVIPGIVVYGHTHKCRVENYKGVLVVNPGSPAWPEGFPRLGTVGLLEIKGDSVEARIVALDEMSG